MAQRKKKSTSKSEMLFAGDGEMTNDLSKYATTSQAAEMLGVETVHVNHLLIGEKIKGVKMGKVWLVFVPSLEKYLVNKSKRGRPSSGEPTLRQIVDKSNGQG